MVLAIIDFIRNHPGIVAAIFSALWTIVGVMILQAYKGLNRRIEHLEAKVDEVEATVSGVQVNYLQKFDELAVGAERNKTEIVDRIHQLEIKLTKPKQRR